VALTHVELVALHIKGVYEKAGWMERHWTAERTRCAISSSVNSRACNGGPNTPAAALSRDMRRGRYDPDDVKAVHAQQGRKVVVVPLSGRRRSAGRSWSKRSSIVARGSVTTLPVSSVSSVAALVVRVSRLDGTTRWRRLCVARRECRSSGR
jgi:hypothetical protein